VIFVQGLPNLVPIDEDDYYDWDEEPVETEEEQTELTDSIDYMRKTLAREKRIRIMLFGLTGLLVVSAPIVSYVWPETWTLILASALAFTIGTNLLISVVTVRVEEKADSMETRMVELLASLHTAELRLRTFHDQLEGINIPGVHQLLENVRDEVAPGLHSLEDIDVRAISLEIRKASAFIETLDMEKVGMYLKHIRKEDYEMRPVGVIEDPEFNDYWAGEPEVDNDTPFIASLLGEEDEEQETNAVLSRLIG